ncbi:MAG: hypothetical protein ORO03_06570 [Alphaproteobacteria bacterium]|nr:hypothetical protein [Alphaproteobacteria bacterium]
MGEFVKFLIVIFVIWLLWSLYRRGRAAAARLNQPPGMGNLRNGPSTQSSHDSTSSNRSGAVNRTSTTAEVMLQCTVCGLYYSANAAVPCEREQCPLKP